MILNEGEARHNSKQLKEVKKELERIRIRHKARQAIFGRLSVEDIVKINEKLKGRVAELEVLVEVLIGEPPIAIDQ